MNFGPHFVLAKLFPWRHSPLIYLEFQVPRGYDLERLEGPKERPALPADSLHFFPILSPFLVFH